MTNTMTANNQLSSLEMNEFDGKTSAFAPKNRPGSMSIIDMKS